MAILPKFLCGRDCRRQYLRPCHPLSAAGPPLYNVNDTPVIPLHVVFSACRQSFSQNPILRAAHCTMAAAAAWCAASSALSAAPSPTPCHAHPPAARRSHRGVGERPVRATQARAALSNQHCPTNTVEPALPPPARPGRQLRVPFAWSSPKHLDTCVPDGVYSGLQQCVQCREECSAFPLKENWGSKP